MSEFTLTKRQHALLVEALRRFECFAVRRDGLAWTIEDLKRAWTGLGTKTTYTPVLSTFMTYATGGCPWRDTWWCLTEQGAEIVLYWHNLGFNCGDGFSVLGDPPRTISKGEACKTETPSTAGGCESAKAPPPIPGAAEAADVGSGSTTSTP